MRLILVTSHREVDAVVTISAFADEISSDLEEQVRVLRDEGIAHLELRSVWNKNVLDLSDNEVEEIRRTLRANGIQVSAIGSPIGKVELTVDFDVYMEKFQRTIDLAEYFGAQYIRIFSFFIPKGRSPDGFREPVMARMKRLVEAAEARDVTLLHENEKGIYGDTPERCLDILQSCASSTLRAAFDPANFVQCGVFID